MKKKVGTFKIWLLAIAAVVAFSVLPKVSSLATEDQALVVKEEQTRLLMLRAMNRLQRIAGNCWRGCESGGAGAGDSGI